MRRLLLIRNDRMGDLLMTLPAVGAIRKADPKAQLTLLVRKGLEPLLEGYPIADRIQTWDPEERQTWPAILREAARLRRDRYDVVVIFNPSRLFHVASFLAGIPLRVGYRRKWGRLLTHSLPDAKAERNLHETEYNLELITLLGIPRLCESGFTFPERPESQRRVMELLASHGVRPSVQPVAVHPWSTNPAKNLPLDFFWALYDRLRESGSTALLIGTSPSIEEGLNLPTGLINLIGKTPLNLLPELLRSCRVLISNDSGPVHVAAAVGTPSVVVAPRSHERLLHRWRPLGPGHRLLIEPTAAEVVEAVAALCAS